MVCISYLDLKTKNISIPTQGMFILIIRRVVVDQNIIAYILLPKLPRAVVDSDDQTRWEKVTRQ